MESCRVCDLSERRGAEGSKRLCVCLCVQCVRRCLDVKAPRNQPSNSLNPLPPHPPPVLFQCRYQQSEEHANFRSLLEAPQHDAQMIMTSRFPVPRSVWGHSHPFICV